MPEEPVRLRPIKVALNHLYLDPNNPRFAKSLNLRRYVADQDVPDVQQELQNLFVNEQDSDTVTDEEEWEGEEGAVRLGDLIRSMKEIGFVPIDRVVVRRLEGSVDDYVVIEGNRRVRAAKYLHDRNLSRLDPDERRKHEQIVETLKELDVLLLETKGLSVEAIHEQIGVILGLRHFGQVLGWGTLAKAVNIYNEYMNTRPAQGEFALNATRITSVATLLSESRSGVTSALKTYIAYKQLQESFPDAQPKPSHYSLLQACVTNRRLGTAGFIEQDGNTFKLSPASLERLNTACEFDARDGLKEDAKILRDPKAVSSFVALVTDAASHQDSAVRAFAASLRDEVLAKERALSDASDNLRSFKSDRVWTESLEALLK
jgi:hypothetical protein